MPTYCVIDLETGVHNKGPDAVGDKTFDVRHPDNHIVVFGRKPLIDPFSCLWWVFQNVAFDFQYMLKEEPERTRAWLEAGGKIWDCQIAEYILTGQQHTYASLDELALKYGGTLKDSRIKDMWEAGVDTEDIDPVLLRDYNQADLDNTELVFLKQYAAAKAKGILPLLGVAFEDRIFTLLMEWNGMRFDREGALASAESLRQELEAKETGLVQRMASVWPETLTFNPGSGDQVSLALFGGKLNYDVRVELPEKVKSGPNKGKPKYGKQERTLVLPEKNRKFAEPVKKEGFFGTDVSVLERLAKAEGVSEEDKKFCELLLEYRGLQKDISTYYVGYSELTWPTDGCIHPNISHTATVTGRQSCSQPNLQNVSREDT